MHFCLASAKRIFHQMKISPSIANTIWLASQKREYNQFITASKNPKLAQEKKLSTYITNNSETVFGKQHGFKDINGYADFIQKVPIHDWESLSSYISDIEKGKQNILTSAKVLLFERTSGTTSFSKLIPYTNTLKREIEQAVAAWMVSLYHQYPKTFKGSAYWAISPATQQISKTVGGISVGIDDDKAYFNPLTSLLLNSILAVPPHIKNIKQTDEFYFQTLIHLLCNPSLSFISVWSPSFFILLDEHLRSRKEILLSAIDKIKSIPPLQKKTVQQILSKTNFTWKELWPQLEVISCWSDAQSALFISKIKERLGEKIIVQGKGLLATEGVTSIPISTKLSPALAVRSHFYEFREPDTNKIYLSHELKNDGIYEVIITTGGGLYRYATGDLIKVSGFFNQCPCFQFLGRKNIHSDLVGEKLSEHQIIEAFSIAFQTIEYAITHAFISPVNNSQHNQYCLYISANTGYENFIQERIASLTISIEGQLNKNPYYQHAIHIGQLKPMCFKILTNQQTQEIIAKLKKGKTTQESVFKLPTLLNSIVLK